MMVLAASLEPSRLGDVFMSFLGIVFEGVPYIAIGTLVSGFIDAFLPAKFVNRALPRNPVLATLVAGFLGLVLPVCECAVVPIIRRLVGKGLPVSCAVTYMFAAPIVNPIVVASTVTAFMNDPQTRGAMAQLGWADVARPLLLLQHLCAAVPMAMARLSLGYVVAVLAGLVVVFFKPGQILRDGVIVEEAAAPQREPVRFDTRLVRALRASMRDFLDTGMYFALGVGVTAIFSTQINQAVLGQVAGNGWLAIPAVMLLALVLSLCSTSDAFIAANLPAFGFPAKLAFLVFGPMMDMKLLFMYSAVFKRRTVIVMLLGLMAVVGFLSGPWASLIQSLATASKS